MTRYAGLDVSQQETRICTLDATGTVRWCDRASSEPAALAVLACILTCTPGTAWVEYDSTANKLLIHVFDLVDEAYWIDLIKNRYERLLLEMLA